MNRRNSEFIFRHNPLKLYALVDNKILTKEALSRHAIPAPAQLFSIGSYFEMRNLEKMLARRPDFVVKPANGFGGEGVMIVNGRRDGGFETAGGRFCDFPRMREHIQDILSGLYSLNQLPDQALGEERLVAEETLARLTFKGIPDIRVLVFRGVPLMAMLRLSTEKSKGRANLHQGGLGVGVDLASGKTTHAIGSGQFITHHPDSGERLIGVTLPHWDEVLELSARCFEAAPLGYMGVDIVIARGHGPMVLELNVRPGLMIQMANRRGLKPLLAAISHENPERLAPTERARLGREAFGRGNEAI